MTKKVGAIENDLLSFIASYAPSSEREPGELTIREIMKQDGRNRNTVERVLKQGIEDGKITRREIMHGGHRVFVYRMKG